MTNPLQRIGEQFRSPMVQAVLAPTQPGSIPQMLAGPRPIYHPTVSVSIPPRGGNGQVRFVSGGDSYSCSTVAPSTSSASIPASPISSAQQFGGVGQLRMLGDRRLPAPHRSRFTAYTRPYNPRQTYTRPHRNATQSAQRSSRLANHSPTLGRKYSKTIVLVSSGEQDVPRGNRRKELHDLGAVVQCHIFQQLVREAGHRSN